MNLNLKQFKKEDLFEYTLSIKSGRHDSDSLKILTNFWILLGPLFVFGITHYFNEYIGFVPSIVKIISTVFIVVSVICLFFSINKIRKHFEKAQSILFLIVLFLFACLAFCMGVILYLQNIYNHYKQFTLEVIPLNIINLILIMGFLSFIIPITSGYITIFTYIKKGKARKENLVNQNEKMSRETFINLLFLFFTPIVFPSMLFFSHVPMNGLFNFILGLLVSYGILFFLPGLATTFYTKWRFPEL
ncbi:hypothetical protein IGJ55_003334 [Enterococcus sp. AZ170]|uniref:hypothetical protein n=1 Tax=Enterococcus TaxID=1350 RepID=UPI001A90EFBE|nr:hypothetical protein [Enterococcus ureilyticus]MBO0447626.1 hypothetical protein [Enterococcus ureilyticus]